MLNVPFRTTLSAVCAFVLVVDAAAADSSSGATPPPLPPYAPPRPGRTTRWWR